MWEITHEQTLFVIHFKHCQKRFYGFLCSKLPQRAHGMERCEEAGIIEISPTLQCPVCCHTNQFGNMLCCEAECQIIRPQQRVCHIIGTIREQQAHRGQIWLCTHVNLLVSFACSNLCVSRKSLRAATATGSTSSLARQARVAQPSGVPRLWPR